MDIIKEINDKFMALEAEVDSKLDAVKREEAKFEKNATSLERKSQNQEEEAMVRNANLIKSLEMTKARLRSRSTFSPVEQILEKALSNYKMDLLRSHQRKTQNCNAAENIYDTVGI
ncbi:uncharacterized protein LOC133324690 [Musca vetustissima]|uniref:uncharacterized protein LOC133324690 n=1 Tax=Musca vetustissima TaxID=27455 RepID=UPI002AB677BB|nr:uncharacterized protein LOC133324690 [Musca vetustissima]